MPHYTLPYPHQTAQSCTDTGLDRTLPPLGRCRARGLPGGLPARGRRLGVSGAVQGMHCMSHSIVYAVRSMGCVPKVVLLKVIIMHTVSSMMRIVCSICRIPLVWRIEHHIPYSTRHIIDTCSA